MSIPPVERTPIQWTNTQGANLYSTGASGPAAVRPVHAVNAVESADKLGEGVTVTIKSPEKPSDKSLEDRDWTEVQEKKVKEEEQEPPKEPIYKQLIEHIQSMWRASAMAVEAAQEAQKTDQQERNMLQVRTEPLTYAEPKVKRTGGL
ncbi:MULTISPECIES: hypothetical protein [Comamonas]|jgi:hypothetical protein|uniref:Uncharacterized protein n=1 Tax=Comamonas aquatica TaxID=225991 RepID=A0AA42HRH8_9BURK|nr:MULTISPECIES: hypothetical protein [Comamonas]ANY61410.1 hypothetical protein MA05_04000 [Comamonas aquatica]MDH0362996.1 hypothetical protein [Comamonas aquatica]MDH0493986.1 hypothetical protein [Comamonas aquatica]MDH0899788.1 hypothetical protein [Comamonas aquatica]MDH1379518.1 hypothetical protein [Comamonas aquatica]